MLTLHHLQHSQSERIIWLLEELTIPYELVLHKRDPLLSPPSLRAINPPLGSAPVLVDGDLTLAESAAIAHYIINKYGDGRLTVRPDDAKYATYLYWLYFVLCSLQPSGSQVMMAYMDPTLPEDARSKTFPKARFLTYIDKVEKRLTEVAFLVGDDLTLADIMVLWVFTTFRDFLPYSLEPYPNVLAYVGRMTERDAYKRAWKRGEGDWKGITGKMPEKKAVL